MTMMITGDFGVDIEEASGDRMVDDRMDEDRFSGIVVTLTMTTISTGIRTCMVFKTFVP